MFDSVKSVFPRRPLNVKYHGILNPVFMFFLSLSFFSGVAFFAYFSSPELLRDMEISKDYVELPDAGVRGKCSFGKRGSTKCDVTITVPAGAKDSSGVSRGFKQHRIELSFWEFSARDYSVTAVASRSNPDLVTIDLAIEKLTQRIILFLGTNLLFLGLSGYFFYKMLEQIRLRRAFKALNGKMLQPVSVDVVSLRKAFGATIAVYSYLVGGKKRKVATRIGKQQPFYLSDAPDDSSALGVTDDKGEVVLLLDEALTRLDFSDSERAALKAARG